MGTEPACEGVKLYTGRAQLFAALIFCSLTDLHTLHTDYWCVETSPAEPVPTLAPFACAVALRHAPGGGEVADGRARSPLREAVAWPPACCVCGLSCGVCVRCGGEQSVARESGRAEGTCAWRTGISRTRFREVEGYGVMGKCAHRASWTGRGQATSRLTSSGAAARGAARSDLVLLGRRRRFVRLGRGGLEQLELGGRLLLERLERLRRRLVLRLQGLEELLMR